MDFDATSQLLIIHSAFLKYSKKQREYNEAVHQLFLDLNETYNIDRLGNYLSDMFPIKNGLKKKRYVLLSLLFNFALDYAVRRIQVNKDGFKLNGTYQSLVYADDFNMLGGSVYTTKKNTEALLVASKESGLEVTTYKAKYKAMSQDRMQNEFTTHRLITVHLRGWNSSNIWEQPKLIKITTTKESRAD